MTAIGSVAPGERVNIVYRSQVGGVETEVELPLKLLILGDFTSRDDDALFEERRSFIVNEHNFNQVINDLDIELSFAVANHLAGGPPHERHIQLRIKSLSDFSPRHLAHIDPVLKQALEFRQILLGLRNRGPEHSEFHHPLEYSFEDRVVGDSSPVDGTGLPESPHHALTSPGLWPDIPAQAAPTGGTVDRPSRNDFFRTLAEYISTAQSTGSTSHSRAIDRLVADLDEKILSHINAILHHPEFQRLESTWRGLDYLVQNTDFKENIIIEILQVTKRELADDFEEAFEILKSGLYRHVYTSEYGQFGGKPYGAIIVAYEFGPGPADMRLLQHLAGVAAMAHAPVISAAAPEFFGSDTFLNLANLKDPKSHFESQRFARWHALREAEDSRHIGLALPRFLLRLPYGPEYGSIMGLAYEEDVRGRHEKYLWGNAAFALAARLTDSFARYRWCPNIVGMDGGGSVENLPRPSVEALGRIEHKIPTETFISEKREYELAEQGFIALTLRNGGEKPCFFSANSIQKPKRYGSTREAREAEFNYRLGTQLPYLFVIVRLAHYLKVIQREHIGTFKERTDLEGELNKWLRQYVADMDDPPPGVRGRRPLRQARVVVSDVEANPGWYRVDMSIRPHLKYMGANFNLALVGKLDKT
jgi:type VI secretion system protein ImpC